MNTKKICLGFMLLGLSIQAQQLPLFNGKLINEYVNNPACAGEKDIARASAFFRTQYDNIPNSPTGFGIMADGKFKGQKHGMGIQLIGQRTNVNALYNGMLTYSYELIPDKDAKQRLAFGLSVGAFMQQTDFSKIIVNNYNDARLLDGQVSNFAMNANFGVLYRLYKIRISASISNLIGNTTYLRNQYSDTFSVYKSSQHYFGSVSYPINLKKGNPNYILEPYVAVNVVSGLSAKMDWMCTFRYLQKYNVGLGYRTTGMIDFSTSSIVAYSTIKLFDKVDLGYFFETMSGSDHRSALGNSHELQMTYYLPYRR